MSNETKNTTVGGTAPEVKAEATTGKAESRGKKETKPKAAPKTGGALESVGRDACKRHGLAEVWVTADGQSFPQQGDAKAHAANLNDRQILNVKAE